MALNLTIQALTLPAGTEFPGTPQGLWDQGAQYLIIAGQEDFNGINYGPTEPAAADRDKPWFKTDESDNPIGWFAWNGAAWVAAPLVVPSGTTANRPNPASEGQIYFDTDIEIQLIYHNSNWITQAGSPGDIKYVSAATLADALTKNPGWSEYTDGQGYVLAGADGSTYAYNDTVGADEIILSESQLPAHVHEISAKTKTGAGFVGGPASYQMLNVVGDTSTTSTATTLSTGSGGSIDIRQKTRYLWTLIKD